MTCNCRYIPDVKLYFCTRRIRPTSLKEVMLRGFEDVYILHAIKSWNETHSSNVLYLATVERISVNYIWTLNGLSSFFINFLAHLALRTCEILPSLFVCRPSINISHFNLLLRNHRAKCSKTLVEWSLDGPLPNCVRWSRLPTKMATKLKIEKRGDAILIVHCCFSRSQNELTF